MKSKKVEAQLVFSHKELATMPEVNKIAEREIMKMYEEAERLGIKETGPMTFVYTMTSENPADPFDLEIAMLVDKKVDAETRYQFKELPAFECVVTEHKGAITTIGQTWEAFMPKVGEAGFKPSNVGREVYHNWVAPDSEENLTEIQMGIN